MRGPKSRVGAGPPLRQVCAHQNLRDNFPGFRLKERCEVQFVFVVGGVRACLSTVLPPRAVTTLTEMQKRKKKHQFYTACGSEATYVEDGGAVQAAPPHLTNSFLFPKEHRTQDPCLTGPLVTGPWTGVKPLRVKVGGRGPAPCPLGAHWSIGVCLCGGLCRVGNDQ